MREKTLERKKEKRHYMSALGPLIETIGYATEVIFGLVRPGNSSWAKRSYYSSGIALLIAGIFGIDTNTGKILPYSTIIASGALILFLILLVCTPILKEAQLNSEAIRHSAPTRRRVRHPRGTSAAGQPTRQSSPSPHRRRSTKGVL